MLTCKSTALLINLLFLSTLIVNAQGALPKEAKGIITGRVTVGDKPAAGITVAVTSLIYDRERGAITQALTDAEGLYQLKSVPAGRYNVRPLAPVYATTEATLYGQPGKTINIQEGETINDLDFTLARGGVITGRVTDADGRPVIEERLDIELAENSSPPKRFMLYRSPYMLQTDDRGIYRIYGLTAGRYKVSVGADSAARPAFNNSRGYYARTFHPDVTDEAKAEVIEVAEGAEVSGVDIRLGRRVETYAISGRVLDAENGKPMPRAQVSYGTQAQGSERMVWFSGPINLSNEKGEFQIDGLAPGRYAVFVTSTDAQDIYSDPVAFQVTDADVTGLEVKTRRGASISGTVVLENSSSKSLLAKLSQFLVYATIISGANGLPGNSQSPIGPDGSFRLGGLRPGKLFLNLYSRPSGAEGNFTELRLERDGVEQHNGIEIGSGEQLTNIRLVVSYGTGVVRGDVKVEGGDLPQGSRFFLKANRVGDTMHAMGRPSEVDSRGRFTIEGLASGTYEVTLNYFTPGRPNQRRLLPVKQIVNVTDGTESELTITLNLSEKKEDQQ